MKVLQKFRFINSLRGETEFKESKIIFLYKSEYYILESYTDTFTCSYTQKSTWQKLKMTKKLTEQKEKTKYKNRRPYWVNTFNSNFQQFNSQLLQNKENSICFHHKI